MAKKLTGRAIGLTLTGAVIGAGFASGQEIKQFFVSYGRYANRGAVMTIVFFVIFCSWLMTYCRHHRIAGLPDMLKLMGGKRLGAFFLHLINLFMWFGLSVMLAGSATLLAQLWQLPRLASALITGLLVYLVARKQVKGLAVANDMLLPLLIFLVLFFLLRSVGVPEQSLTLVTRQRGWLWSALLYLGSNSAILLTTIPALISETDRRSFKKGVFIAAGLLLFLLLTNIYLLNKYAAVSGDWELPLLPIAQYLLPQLPWAYGVILFIALITTAFANAVSLSKYFQQLWPVRANFLLLVAIWAAAFLAQEGFGQLVATLYPLTGYLCLIFYLVSLLRLLFSFDSSC